MATPRFLPSRRHKFIVKTAADYSLTSTTWANLDTTTDQTVEAQVNDVLKAYLCAEYNNEAQSAFINAATWSGSALVNYFGSGEPTTTTGDGVPGWMGPASILFPVGAAKRYTVQAGDIVNGLVTVRLRYRATGTKTLRANTLQPFEFAVENIGPVQGH